MPMGPPPAMMTGASTIRFASFEATKTPVYDGDAYDLRYHPSGRGDIAFSDLTSAGDRV
jgi:hypothetical protein